MWGEAVPFRPLRQEQYIDEAVQWCLSKEKRYFGGNGAVVSVKGAVARRSPYLLSMCAAVPGRQCACPTPSTTIMRRSKYVSTKHWYGSCVGSYDCLPQ